MALANTKKNDSKTELMGKDNGQAGEGATGPGSAEWLAERPGIQNAIEKGHAPFVDLQQDHGIGILLRNDFALTAEEFAATETDNPALAAQLESIDADGDLTFDYLFIGLANVLNDRLGGALDPDAVAQFDMTTFDPADIESAVLHKSDGTEFELAWVGAKGIPFLALLADDDAYVDLADVNTNNDETPGTDWVEVTLVGGETGVFQLIDQSLIVL